MREYNTFYNEREWVSRPRLNVLLSQGVTHPLILVVAGSGYGKTCAVSGFITKTSANAIWFRANTINNYPERFWRTLKKSIDHALPSLTPDLKELPFPKTFQQQDHFLRLFAKAVYASSNQVLLVLDDMQNVQSEDIKGFFRSLLEAALENFCLIAISNTKSHAHIRPKMLQALPFHITADDLRYTDAEIAQRLEMSGISASEAAVTAAQKHTGGWPLAVHVLANHWKNEANFFSQTSFSIETFTHMFYSDYYTQYDPAIQLMLVKLAYLPMFSLETVSAIGGCNLQDMAAIIRTNPFILNDSTHIGYAFQVVYQSFLKSCFIIDEEEQKRIRLLAAQEYHQNGFAIEAVEAYLAAGAYDGAFSVIREQPFEKADHDTADFFLKSLVSFPEDYLAEHPYARIQHALLHIFAGQRQKACDMLLALLPEYQGSPEITGEISLAIGELTIEKSVNEALPYYKTASECLPYGSKLRIPNALYFINRSLVKLHDTKVGSLKSDLANLKKVAEYSAILYQRSTDAWYGLTLAEAAYYQMNLDTARRTAFQSAYTAALHDQYDIQCNAWFLLLRIEMMYGNLSAATDYLLKIDALIKEKGLDRLLILRDCIAGWFHLRIGNLSGMPRWLTEVTADVISRLLLFSERDIILRVLYKIESGDYAEALAMANAFIPYCETHLFWTIRLYLFIAKAIIHSKMDQPEESLSAFREAYRLTYNNGLVVPFIETSHHMRSLVGKIRKMADHGLDDAWLDNIYTKASSYAKRINSMSRDYAKMKGGAVPGEAKFSLSARETEVLEYLSKGLKYEEISDFMDISINGVKKHITSIYSKLGAINRADAIHIAMSEGIIS